MTRDPAHWLYRFTPDEWLAAGMRELAVARTTFARHAARPALASARRAAGMAWNAVLALEPRADAHDDRATRDPRFGRTYADHLSALAAGACLDEPAQADDDDPSPPEPIPDEVRAAARALMDEPGSAHEVVQILTPRHDDRVLAAAETVLAEAYARVVRRRHAEGGAERGTPGP